MDIRTEQNLKKRRYKFMKYINNNKYYFSASYLTDKGVVSKEIEISRPEFMANNFRYLYDKCEREGKVSA